MRFLMIIFLVLIILALFGFMFIANIEIDAKLANIDLDNFVQSLFQKKPVVKTTAKVTVNNGNPFRIKLSEIYIEVFDGDTLIARSIEPSGTEIIPRENYESFNHSFDIYISNLLLDKIKSAKLGKEVQVTYKVRGKLYGIPVKFKNQYNYLG